MSTTWREAAGDKATAEGYECFHIKQRGRRAECDAYLLHGIWAATWPGPTPIKAKVEHDELTIPFDFAGINAAPPFEGAGIVASTEPREPVKQPLPVAIIAEIPEKLELPAVKSVPPVKSPLPVTRPEKKYKDVLPNGRTKKPMPSFDQWHCRIFPKDMTYPAWRSLTKAATDVANICRAKRDRAAAMGKKNSAGLPVFDFTFSEAENVFRLTRPTFSNAMKQLLEIGFLKHSRHGGICNGVGIMAQYTLSDEWKKWEPPKRDNSNMTKARSAKNRIPVKAA